MPPKTPPSKTIGRPAGQVPPRKTQTVRLDIASIEWINENVPRGVSLSTFVNIAVQEKIARETSRPKKK